MATNYSQNLPRKLKMDQLINTFLLFFSVSPSSNPNLLRHR